MAEEPRGEVPHPVEPDNSPTETEPAVTESEGAHDAAPEDAASKPAIEGLQGIDTAQVWITGFLILIAGVIAYSNAFSIPFHYLDQQVIQENADAHRIVTVPQALDVENAQPLPMLTYAINWSLSGGTPGPFHAANILLHALNALLVYVLCRKLMPERVPEPVPMLAGLFVALNPLATESVNYIVGRSALMLTFFSLLAVVFFIRAADRREGISFAGLSLSLLAMVMAWYCGLVAALIPLSVLAVDWILHGKGMFRRASVHAAYWGLLAALVAVWYAGQPQDPPYEQLVTHTPHVTANDRAAAFMQGIESTVSPTALTVEHNLPPRVSQSLSDGERVNVTLTAINGAVLAGLAIVFLAFRSMVGFGLLWYVAALTWTAFSFSAEAPFSERGLYFPLCGIVLIIPWLVGKASARRVTQLAAAAAAVVLLVAAGSGTFLRNRVWQEPLSLWQDAAAKTPSSPFPLERLGGLYFEGGVEAVQQAATLAQEGQAPAAAGRQEEAQQLFTVAQETLSEARELNPENATTIYRLGRCASLLGQRDEAVELICEALWHDPSNFEYTTQLALNLLARANTSGEMNDRLSSIDYFRRAQELGTLPPELRTQFASLLGAIGELEAAQQELSEVVAATDYAPAARQLEQDRRRIATLVDMEQRARATLQEDPQSQDGLLLQAEVLLGRGNLIQGSYVLARLLTLYPEDIESWVMMGVCRAMVDDEQGFLSRWPRAPMAEVGQPSAWIQLARRCASTGRWDAARTYLEAAVGKTPEAALPLVSLAEIALSLDAVSVATQYLEDATRQYPDSPRPWLLLCDIAVASDNQPAARRYLAEAEKRGAAGPEVEQRRARVGTGPVDEKQDDFETLLR